MAEPEDPSSNPTELSASQGGSPSRPVEKLNDLAIEALLGAARPGGQHASNIGAWQLPSPEELQSDFPQFEIAGVLGRGGMGAVYKGWQKSLDRFVAIKILPPEVQDLDPHFAERFKHEAKAMAHLSHPAICLVFDAGETPGGLLYFVMECIENGDLGQKIAVQGRLSPAEAIAIAGTICDALQFAHESGIVHRDIKPSNILLNAHGQWKVADFGLAKLVGQATNELTLSDTAMGSPAFASPEALTDGASVDHRADIYAVGVMLHQMLTGSIPRGAFEMPSQIVPGLDPSFDAIVAKAMQPDRERRYASALEMRRDLDRLVAGVFSPAPSAAAASRASPSSSTSGAPPRRASRLAALAAGLVILVGGGWWTTHRPGSGTLPRAAESKLDATTKEHPFVNSLGMQFVPVPITGGPSGGQRGSPENTSQPLVPGATTSVLFSVWETRVQDYEVFAAETKREWPKRNFEQGPTHPAVMVSWDDAQAFCAWLTQREHQTGRLGSTERYRLPTDHEWSCAVGIGDREDAAKRPEEKSEKIADVFPWGATWPPPLGTGNYAGEEFQPALESGKYSYIKGVLTGYRDGYVETAPVGSFAASSLGLMDLSGNAWEWCEDWFNAAEVDRVLRGSSWLDRDRRRLLSSHRFHYSPGAHIHNFGFRCVLASSAQAISNSPAPPVSPSTPATATKDAPFVNTLGMKFVPVPVTGGPTDGQRVLFSVWETRVRDYEGFAAETRREWPKPDFPQDPTHPAVNVSWDDAQAFGVWLTERDRKAGRLGARQRYRLPTDHEWSCAVGIGDREDPARPPEEKSEELIDVFPWGVAWPPPRGAGNYSGDEAAGHETWKGQSIMAGYRDDFPETAPVGSFTANRLGIHDLGGNAWEWCEDLFKPPQTHRVMRGGSFNNGGRGGLYASKRDHHTPDDRKSNYGFRVVLAPVSPTAAPD